VTFSLVVDAANWLFIDPAAPDNSGTGAIGSPFKDTTPFTSGSTYAGKCVYMRGGTHNLKGMGAGPIFNYTFNGSQPGVFVGYPSEAPIIEMTTGYFSATARGFALYGLELKHGPTPFAPNQRMVIATGNAHRLLWAECSITHYTVGTSTGDNPGCIFIDYGAGRGQYVCISYNDYTGVCGSGVHGGYVENCVIHGNRWHDVTQWISDTSQGGVVFFKYSSHFVSIRANQCWENVGYAILGNKTTFGFKGSNAAYPTEYGVNFFESCYNTLYAQTTTDRLGTIGEYDNNAGDGDMNEYHLYRNSFGTRHECEVAANVVITDSNRENNILTGGQSFTTGRAEIVMIDNLQAGTYLDVTTMKLNSANRPTYLGTHGAEIA
jgi:hypothetical protein